MRLHGYNAQDRLEREKQKMSSTESILSWIKTIIIVMDREYFPIILFCVRKTKIKLFEEVFTD